MKVLWLINSPLPEALAIMSGRKSEKTGSGGWQVALADDLSNESDIELFVASSAPVEKIKSIKGKRITHVLVPTFSVSKQVVEQGRYWKRINEEIGPNVVHIHGTEYLHGISFLIACGSDSVVISLQGMVSVIARYYRLGISDKEIRRALTPYDLLRRVSISDQEKMFEQKGRIEKDAIKKVQHVIGRTSWDRVHTLAINPNVQYHFCNESLREEFYDGNWEYKNCIPHTIFLSQASYPVKGLHQFIKALKIVRELYPDVMTRIAGPDFIHPVTTREKLMFGGYSKLICKLLDYYSLNDAVTFTGPLTAQQMKQEYLRANVFVCPSTIENSPNSLGEAQLLGVPSVASYVGGIPDFIPNNSCGKLFRFEETEMLATHICDYFQNASLFDNTEMRKLAMKRHDRIKNAKRTLDIYKEIASE